MSLRFWTSIFVFMYLFLINKQRFYSRGAARSKYAWLSRDCRDASTVYVLKKSSFDNSVGSRSTAPYTPGQTALRACAKHGYMSAIPRILPLAGMIANSSDRMTTSAAMYSCLEVEYSLQKLLRYRTSLPLQTLPASPRQSAPPAVGTVEWI